MPFFFCREVQLEYLADVRSLYRSLGFAAPRGCSSREIKSLERQLSAKLPAAYVEFLAWMGHGAGKFLRGSRCWAKFLMELNSEAVDLMKEDESTFSLPKDAFVFWMHQGYQFLFFSLSDGDDPPLHWYMKPRLVKRRYPSLNAFLTQELTAHAQLRDEIRGQTIVSAADAKQRVSIHPRRYDAELKILENIASKLGGVRGEFYPDKSGTVNLTSEQPMCIGCLYALRQFNDMFPNVRVNVTELEKA
jgi:hypothetical protein